MAIALRLTLTSVLLRWLNEVVKRHIAAGKTFIDSKQLGSVAKRGGEMVIRVIKAIDVI